MKLAGMLLMTLGLMFGALAASTAYHVKVADIAPADRLTLNENTGKKLLAKKGETLTVELVSQLNKSKVKEVHVKLAAKAYKMKIADIEPEDLEQGLTLGKDVSKPLVKKGDTLTAELVSQLKKNEVYAVLVKEFSVGRWKWNWVFLLSMAALIGGAWLLKRSDAAEMSSGDSEPHDSPAHALQATADGLDALLGQLDQTSETGERLRLIVEGVGELQRTHVAAFVDARDKLVAEFGIGGMAELMDQFSRAERQINRAWSAACDEHEEEALLCVQAARPLLDAPLEKLRENG